MEKKDNVILIGMPGVGKSSAGVVLAKAIGYKFVDSDIVIQETDGRLLKDIIADEGVEGFIEVENRINATLDVKHSVVATGGSAVYGADAMEHFKNIGIIVYLKADYEEICKRLGDFTDRGVVMREGRTFKDVYDERTVLYEKYADIVVEENGQGIRETVMQLSKRLEGHISG